MTRSQDDSTCDAALEDEALAWVNRALSGLLTFEDAEELLAWRAQSAAHERAFAEAVLLQRAIRGAVIEARRTAFEASLEPAPSTRPRRRTPGSRGSPRRSGRTGRR
jgi:transmembrane sensor